jgi:hypothetical protein
MFFNKKKKPKSDSMTKVVEKCVFDRNFFIVGDVYVLRQLGKKIFGICTEVSDDTVHFKTQNGSCWLSCPASQSNKIVAHISIKDYE